MERAYKKMVRSGWLIVLAGLLVNVPMVYSAEYSLDRFLKFNSVYRDDSSFGATNSEPYMEYNVYPEFDFSKKTENTSLQAGLGAHVRRFDADQFDSDEYNASILYEKRYERATWSVSSGSKRSSTFIDNEQGVDNSLNNAESRTSQTGNANFRFSYQLSQQDTLIFSLGGVDRAFDTSDRVDSESVFSSLRYVRAITERFSLQAVLNGNHYSSDDSGFAPNAVELKDAVRQVITYIDANETPIPDIEAVTESQLLVVANSCISPNFDSLFDANTFFLRPAGVATIPCYSAFEIDNTQKMFGGELGFTYAFNELLMLDFLAGQSRISTVRETQFAVTANPSILVDNDQNISTYKTSLSYRKERLNYKLSASRSTSATGSGVLQLKDAYSFSSTFNASESDSLSFNLTWFSEELSDRTFANTDRERLSASLDYSRRLTEDWHISTGYTYYDEKRDSLNSTERQRITLTIEWQPTTLKWSR